MCGRYVLKKEDLEALVRQFGVHSLEEFHSRYNIAPTSIVPLIRPLEFEGMPPMPPEDRAPGDRPGDSQPGDATPSSRGLVELTGVRWGLIPAWTKPDLPVRPLVNVRAETLVTRFKGALKRRRCVLPASGFYEWETVGSRKQPWYFAMRDGGAFGLAGIWDTWRGGDGVVLETCAIITTTPNGLLGRIHDRMPVMLTPDQVKTWVNTTESKDAEALLASAPDEGMIAARVGPSVSNVRNDGPECIAAAPDDPGDTEPQLSLGL
jgi:putative SOS response-associated peptidase YedK